MSSLSVPNDFRPFYLPKYRVVKFQFWKSALIRKCPTSNLPSMTKTSTKKRSNKKSAATAAALAAVAVAVTVTKKRLSTGHTNTGQPRKKTRKSVSHQQTIQARDTLDAEYRDWRTGVSKMTICSPTTLLFPMLCVLHVCLCLI